MQLRILTEEKNLLAEKLNTTKKGSSYNDEECKMKVDPIFKNINDSCVKSSLEAVTDSFIKNLQAGILLQLSFH